MVQGKGFMPISACNVGVPMIVEGASALERHTEDFNSKVESEDIA
jgi:hypothetical protein